MFKKVQIGTGSRLTIVDHNESYGRHILNEVSKKWEVSSCIDLGCGQGSDLSIIKNNFPNARLIGVDFGDWNREILKDKGIEVISVNIEHEKLPFPDSSIDLIIANQVLEHTKEIYWINQEVFRVLKKGGIFFIGVPNILSFHNRILMFFGIHPTQAKLISAHVRIFSKNDTVLFYREIADKFCELVGFYGSQFYPFPKLIARVLSRIFPTSAFSNFFVFRKINDYDNEFLEHPKSHVLETNFYIG